MSEINHIVYDYVYRSLDNYITYKPIGDDYSFTLGIVTLHAISNALISELNCRKEDPDLLSKINNARNKIKAIKLQSDNIEDDLKTVLDILKVENYNPIKEDSLLWFIEELDKKNIFNNNPKFRIKNESYYGLFREIRNSLSHIIEHRFYIKNKDGKLDYIRICLNENDIDIKEEDLYNFLISVFEVVKNLKSKYENSCTINFN